jgi:hypothetical protein
MHQARHHITEIAPHAGVELICAFWQIHFDDDEPRIAPRRLVDRTNAANLLARCLTESQQQILQYPISSLGLKAAVGVAAGAIPVIDLTPSQRESWLTVQCVIEDRRVKESLEEEMSILLSTLEIDPAAIERMHRDSRYAEAKLLRPLLKGALTIRIVPSLFMAPAPGGKFGYVQNTRPGRRLTLTFGYAGQLDGGLLDWPQWQRLGIWHILARAYWEERFAALAMPLDEREAAYARLPKPFLWNVGIHDFHVGAHADWAAFVIDHLVSATKVLCEEEVGGAPAGMEQAKWLKSLGRFSIDWFVKRLRGSSLEDVSLPALMAAWDAGLPGLAAAEPSFPGPLGACENPLWNQHPRLVFSPSIGEEARRALQVWFARYWPAAPEPEIVAAPYAGDWDERCNLVFCVASDHAWREALTGAVSIDALSGESPYSLIYVHKNRTQPQRWTRVCLAPDDDALMAVYQDIRSYADWTAQVDGKRLSGPIAYDAAGIAHLVDVV